RGKNQGFHFARRRHPNEQTRQMTKIAILGAGSWGTSLAIVLSRTHKKHEISMWARDPALAEILKRHRENSTYLPGVFLPVEIDTTSDLRATIAGADIVIGAMPSAHARSIYSLAAAELSPETIIVSATKGLEPATHLRISKVIAQVFAVNGRAESLQRLAVLSGPSFAAEAARGEPTAIVLAS